MCLLCGTLAWLELKKAQIQSKRHGIDNPLNQGAIQLEKDLDLGAGVWTNKETCKLKTKNNMNLKYFFMHL